MAKILGTEFKEFWASEWDGDPDAYANWYEITLKSGLVIDIDSGFEVSDISDSAIITKIIGEVTVNGKTVKLSTMFKKWKESQSTFSYLLKVDYEHAVALINLMNASSLKFTIEKL
jgi:hypothetical protein